MWLSRPAGAVADAMRRSPVFINLLVSYSAASRFPPPLDLPLARPHPALCGARAQNALNHWRSACAQAVCSPFCSPLPTPCLLHTCPGPDVHVSRPHAGLWGRGGAPVHRRAARVLQPGGLLCDSRGGGAAVRGAGRGGGSSRGGAGGDGSGSGRRRAGLDHQDVIGVLAVGLVARCGTGAEG